MAVDSLAEFHGELFQRVLRGADAEGRFVEDSFFEAFCEQLIEAGELETADRAYFVSPRGLRVDGSGGPPSATDGTLTLIVADFSPSPDTKTLTATEMEAVFKRGTSFVTKALDRRFRDALEESSAGFGLAVMISSSWSVVSKIRLLLITNKVLSARVDGMEAGKVEGIPISYSVWDIGRLHRYVLSGRSREPIVVNLTEHGGPLRALPAHLNNTEYESYLLVVPGAQLASIYAKWGARLLEQNVRVFLQARGGVNRGIRNTLENDPQMFFAYNNGITATAEKVAVSSGDSLMITELHNLQIVNGGQTTASVYWASRKPGADLARVFVQMKLSVISPERTEEVVPRISEYANSQNKISAADFFANHPFHLRFKQIADRIYAPSEDGTFKQSKWFYERARGQYQDARSHLSTAERRKFDLEFPGDRVVSKTDLAKYLNVWLGHPDVVSKGAQKNFASFADYVDHAWEQDETQFNEVFYHHSVAKAIIFRETEAIVTGRPWYEGGYRANVVAYAIAKLAQDVESMGRAVAFEKVWRSQKMLPGLLDAITAACDAVKDVIVNPPEGTVTNVTEWAKQAACWSRVQDLKIKWPTALQSALISQREEAHSLREGAAEQEVLNGIQAQTKVVEAGAELWKQVAEWADRSKVLSVKEREILQVATRIPRQIPSDQQSRVIVQALKRLHAAGCPLGKELLL